MPGLLDDLVAPIKRAAFLSEYWETRPLVRPGGAPGRHGGLFSFAVADGILTRGGLRSPEVRLVRDGKVIPPQLYCFDAGSSNACFKELVDPSIVLEWFEQGATLVLQGLERTHPPLRSLCVAPRHKLRASVRANAYLTPAGDQGLGLHCDPHDVFVLQIEGRKRWSIRSAPVSLPLECQFPRIDPGAAIELFEQTLEPGGLAYLPRGIVHDACALEEPSLHVTLGVRPITWVDVFRELVIRCEEHEAFRRSAVDLAGHAQVNEQFEMLVQHRTELAGLDHVLDDLEDEQLSRVPADLSGVLVAKLKRCEIDLETWMERCKGTPMRVVEHAGDLVVVLPRKKLWFPLQILHALSHVDSGSPYRVGSLPAADDY